MDDSMEGARKKRDSQIGKDEAVLPPKKPRSVRGQVAADMAVAPNETSPGNAPEETAELDNTQSQDYLSDQPRAWDLESALNQLVRLGSSSNLSSTNNRNAKPAVDAQESSVDSLEKLSLTTSLHFRMGHAGDASTIAELYRSWQADQAREQAEPTIDKPAEEADDENVTANHEANNQEVMSSAADDLEVWLADAVGNEDVPPCAFVLMAELRQCCAAETDAENAEQDAPSSSSADQSLLVALAIMTQVWEGAARLLRIEWLYIRQDHDLAALIERRMWLRLSALALMTESEGIIVKESVKDVVAKDGGDDANDRDIDSES